METIAIYHEPRIKTFGFREATELSLIKFRLAAEGMAAWGLKILELGELGIPFQLVLGQYTGTGGLHIHALFDRQWEPSILEHIRRTCQWDIEKSADLLSPIEMISFYGPHYGDRYGIAHCAFQALANEAIPVLLAGCSVSAIYLVLPEGTVRNARTILSETFEVPLEKAPGKI